jgi:hypothetical protein
MARVINFVTRLTFVAVMGLGAQLSSGVQAAELGAPAAGPRVQVSSPSCKRIWTCHGDLCHWRQVCWHGCPDRYSCYPLYGAYGPYGGSGYWGAYGYGDIQPY